MPEIISETFAEMSAVTGADVTATVYLQATDLDDVVATATVDGTAGAAAQSATSQRVSLAVKVDGVEVDPTLLLSGSEVSRSVESTLQSGTFVVPIEAGGVGQFGSPFTGAGPATGLRTISIYGVYETTTGRHLVPLITGGIADSSDRSDGGGYTETLVFSDRGGRFDRKKVSVVFPPGHGFNRDEVARAILTRAGETGSRLETMAQMNKELALSKAEPLDTIQGSLMDIEHRRLLWDRDGLPWNPKLGPPRDDEPVRWTFTASDIYDLDRVNLTHNADVITKVIATGTAQELLGTCDPLSETQRIETEAIYAPHRPAYAQETGGYTANPAEVIGDDPILVELKIIETTTKCGTVVRTRTFVYSWKNPEIARYEWDAVADTWDRLGSVFRSVFTETNEDDDEPAYAFDAERWALTSVDDLREYYFQNGFQLPWSSSQYAEMAGLQFPPGVGEVELDERGYIIDPLANIKLGSHRLSWNYYAPRDPQRTRSIAALPYDDWEEVEPTNGLDVLGSKEAVQIASTTNPTLVHPQTLNSGNAGEMLILTNEDIEILEPDETGRFMVRKEVHSYGWDVRPNGVQYWYGEDLQSNDSTETYRKVQITTEDYVGVGEDQHNVIRTAYDRDNREIDGQPDEFGLGGWLPAMDRLPDTAPDESLYENDTDVLTKHGEAIRRDQRQMRVEVEAEELLGYHEENEVEASLEWAENEEELEFAARMMIAESAAASLSFTLAGFNAYVQEADIVHVTYSPLGLDHDVRVIQVSHTGGYPDGPLLTKLDMLLYGWE